MIELAAILALAALLALREWGARVDRRAAAAALARCQAEIASERAQAAAEHQDAAKERRELYQRIQAPETAVVEHVRRERGPYQRRKPIGADDDAAFAERDERG